jgi:hypothetical protein
MTVAVGASADAGTYRIKNNGTSGTIKEVVTAGGDQSASGIGHRCFANHDYRCPCRFRHLDNPHGYFGGAWTRLFRYQRVATPLA